MQVYCFTVYRHSIQYSVQYLQSIQFMVKCPYYTFYVIAKCIYFVTKYFCSVTNCMLWMLCSTFLMQFLMNDL